MRASADRVRDIADRGAGVIVDGCVAGFSRPRLLKRIEKGLARDSSCRG